MSGSTRKYKTILTKIQKFMSAIVSGLCYDMYVAHAEKKGSGKK